MIYFLAVCGLVLLKLSYSFIQTLFLEEFEFVLFELLCVTGHVLACLLMWQSELSLFYQLAPRK